MYPQPVREGHPRNRKWILGTAILVPAANSTNSFERERHVLENYESMITQCSGLSPKCAAVRSAAGFSPDGEES